MNRLEIRNRARFFMDEPVQQNFSDSDLNIAINIAQLQVELEIVQTNEYFFVSPTPVTLSITPGNESYALHLDSNSACDVLKITRVEDGATGTTLLPVDQNEKIVLPGMYAPIVVGGSVLNFYLLGDYICFTPTPQMNTTVKYWYVPMLPDLANDTDISAIPRTLHDMIAIQVAMDAMIKDEADTSALERRWARLMDQLKRTVRNRQTEEPKRVRRSADVKDPTIRYPNNIWQ